MKNVKIKVNYHGNMGCHTSLNHPQAPLGWSGGLSNVTLDIINVPSEVQGHDVVSLFNGTAIIPSYEDFGFRLPFEMLRKGGIVFLRDIEKIKAATSV